MKKTFLLPIILTAAVLTGSLCFAGEAGAVSKAAQNTKKAAHNTASAAKTVVQKTADGTKNIISDIFEKEVSAAELEKQSSIKILKSRKKELKDAYNSRIKDTKAKIKLIEKSTVMSDTQKESKIHSYESQILELEEQRDAAVKKYSLRIKELKQN